MPEFRRQVLAERPISGGMTLFSLPDPDTLYAALVARDTAYDGRAYVTVRSTGIFCRLSCPARKPLRRNCDFYETPAQCLEAGFRPCKRCHPLRSAAAGDPLVGALLAALEERPAHRWSEADIAALGHDPSTVRRVFRRQIGMTFLALARQRRLREGFTALAAGEPVIAAQIDAGFESPSAFRAAFARLVGCAPGSFRRDARLRCDAIDTPLGPMVAVVCDHALHLLEFIDRKALPGEIRRLSETQPGGIGFGRTAITGRLEQELTRYFSGHGGGFQTPLCLHGTPFEREVWTALQQIAPAQQQSYGQLARSMGRSSAARAVARANGRNQIAILIPCHRVVGADGSLTGYGGGLWRKQRLLDLEQRATASATGMAEVGALPAQPC